MNASYDFKFLQLYSILQHLATFTVIPCYPMLSHQLCPWQNALSNADFVDEASEQWIELLQSAQWSCGSKESLLILPEVFWAFHGSSHGCKWTAGRLDPAAALWLLHVHNGRLDIRAVPASKVSSSKFPQPPLKKEYRGISWRHHEASNSTTPPMPKNQT